MSFWQSVNKAFNAEDSETKQRDKKLYRLFGKVDAVMTEFTLNLSKPSGDLNGATQHKPDSKNAGQ